MTVWPVGENGLRIREVADLDFGTLDRRGYQRIIPNDGRVPATASAPRTVELETQSSGNEGF